MGRVACARAAAERDSLPHAVRDGVRRLPTNAHHARMQHCPRTLITRKQHCPRTLITRACKTHIQRSSRRMQHAHTAFICVSLVARRPLHATASRWWRAGRCMQLRLAGGVPAVACKLLNCMRSGRCRYAVMGLISPVSQSVANTLKRALLIWLSILHFGNEVTWLSVFGTAACVGGVFAYNHARRVYPYRETEPLLPTSSPLNGGGDPSAPPNTVYSHL